MVSLIDESSLKGTLPYFQALNCDFFTGVKGQNVYRNPEDAITGQSEKEMLLPKGATPTRKGRERNRGMMEN